MIVKDIKKLNQPCQWVGTIEEGEAIATDLFLELNKTKTGIGLSANQIGIDKRVCIINVKEPIHFINPRIVNKSQKTFMSVEGCLSFPNKKVRVKRYSEITVEADNINGSVVFSAETGNNQDILECACIQHEIDHLDGYTMFDREFIIEPIKSKKKIGRNQKVEITNGKISKMIKWKKAKPLVETGDWSLSYGTVEVVE